MLGNVICRMREAEFVLEGFFAHQLGRMLPGFGGRSCLFKQPRMKRRELLAIDAPDGDGDFRDFAGLGVLGGRLSHRTIASRVEGHRQGDDGQIVTEMFHRAADSLMSGPAIGARVIEHLHEDVLGVGLAQQGPVPNVERNLVRRRP